MPIYKQIEDKDVKVVLWQITETEQELMDLVGLDLSAEYSNLQRRMERMAVMAILNHLGIKETICYHDNRRPYIADFDHHISISHAGKMVAIALCKTQNIGIDIETTNRKFKAIAQKYLSQNELAWIDANHNQSMALAWCIKESVYKLPWNDFKHFKEDIRIKRFGNLKDRGEVDVEISDQNSIHLLSLKYLFFNEFCLTWVAY